MTKEATRMINMASSIARINGIDIERLDLQKVHLGVDGKFDYYFLTVWYSNGMEIKIREDCTIAE